MSENIKHLSSGFIKLTNFVEDKMSKIEIE